MLQLKSHLQSSGHTHGCSFLPFPFASGQRTRNLDVLVVRLQYFNWFTWVLSWARLATWLTTSSDLIWFCFCLLALNFSDPRWTPLSEHISTQTYTGYGFFVLFLINRVWHVYYVSEPTPQLVYTTCPFRLLSSCSPHWNSTMLSIPASLAPTFPCFPPSFLLFYLLSCSPTVSFGLLSVASTYLSASTTPRILTVSHSRWQIFPSIPLPKILLCASWSSVVLASQGHCCTRFVGPHFPVSSARLLYCLSVFVLTCCRSLAKFPIYVHTSMWAKTNFLKESTKPQGLMSPPVNGEESFMNFLLF